MTGLHQLIVRCPEVVTRFTELHAMFATGNNVSLMQFDDKPRGSVQFNVACDPQAAHAILKGLPCPIYLLPTEVTRVKGIGFGDAKKLRQALPSNAGTRELCRLYAIWYEAAVKPHQAANPDELIYIHDLAAAFSLDAGLRQAIYNVVPVDITSVPHLPNEEAGWGTVEMKQVETPTNVFAANALTEGGAAAYLSALKRIFA
jgi:inosine-uridine nucleoside N-ribohydrolase